MAKVQTHRVTAFCDWLETLPAGTPFHSQPAFRFYADLTDVDIVAASIEMRRRADAFTAEADALSNEARKRRAVRNG